MRFYLVPLWTWFFVAFVFYALAEYFTKAWSTAPTARPVLLAAIGYFLSTICWFAIMYSRNQLVLMSMTWYLIGSFITICIGAVLFHESLTSVQWLGVGLGVIALLLISSN